MQRKIHRVSVKQKSDKITLIAQVTPEQVVAAMERAVLRIQQMSHRERVKSLKDAGILTRTGKLGVCYR